MESIFFSHMKVEYSNYLNNFFLCKNFSFAPRAGPLKLDNDQKWLFGPLGIKKAFDVGAFDNHHVLLNLLTDVVKMYKANDKENRKHYHSSTII